MGENTTAQPPYAAVGSPQPDVSSASSSGSQQGREADRSIEGPGGSDMQGEYARLEAAARKVLEPSAPARLTVPRRYLRSQPRSIRRAPDLPKPRSEAHPLIENYRRARYGPPRVLAEALTHPRNPRPREG